ncbi:MAG TPA: hypothetical protein VMH04_19615 [Candidatus Solibacter sp.]|nr:hypothetical protein [Candidatus Solibacter sp.]
MRIAFAVLLGISASLVAAQENRIEAVGKSPVEAKFVAGGDLRFDLCSSGIEIVGRDEPMLRLSFDSQRYEGRVKARIIVKGNQAEIRVTDCPHNNFQLRIEVPKTSDLYARMFAGELDVRGVSGNKDVQLRAGQLNIEMGDPAEYAHVDASVNSGEVNASPYGVDKGGLFRSFDRSGPGKYRLHAHVGAGELDLR